MSSGSLSASLLATGRARKVFTLQNLPVCEDDLPSTVGKEAGFSLHSGVAARAHVRDKVERLWCYVSRPPVAESQCETSEFT